MTFTHSKTHYMIGSESTYGTEVATSTVVGTVRNVNPSSSWELFEVRGAGDGMEVQDFLRTRFNSSHSVVIEMHDFTILRHLVGPLSGAGSSGDPYLITEADQVGTTSSTDILPFSAELGSVAASDDVDTYTGCLVRSVGLQADIGQVLVGTFDVLSQGITSSTSATSYTPLTTTPFHLTSGVFSYGATPSSVSGIRSANITYTNRYAVYGDFNTTLISQPILTKREISWSVTCVMTSTIATTLRDDFYGQANTPITGASDIVVPDTAEISLVFDEGSSTGDKDATIHIDHCVVESINKPISVGTEDVVLVTFNGRATTSKSNVFVSWFTN